MKNLNTPIGAGNTHAQTEATEYATGAKLFPVTSDKYDYQLHVVTVNPASLNFQELLQLPEVIAALDAKNLNIHPLQVVEFTENRTIDANSGIFNSYIYKISFIAPKESAINAILIDIDSEGIADRKCTALKRKPFIPELTSDIIQVNSLDLRKNYSAAELVKLAGLSFNQFQLLSFIAQEGNNPLNPGAVCVDEFKYSIYLMRL